MSKKVSESVINRLPRYYRYLTELDSAGIERISSRELSRRMNITASQIRQDLNCFGGFGQQGYGYNIKFLKEHIEKILGLDRGFKAILIGAGNMGQTFAINTKFESRGFKLIGIFDSDPQKYGMQIGEHKVLAYNTVKDFIAENKPQMAIIAVPKKAAENVANALISYGIKAFMNFSNTEISLPGDVTVENVHLSDSLMRLSYKLAEKQDFATEALDECEA